MEALRDQKNNEAPARKRPEAVARAPLGSVLAAAAVVLTPSGQVWAQLCQEEEEVVVSDGDEAEEAPASAIEAELNAILADGGAPAPRAPLKKKKTRGALSSRTGSMLC